MAFHGFVPDGVVAVAANPIRETRGVYAGESIFPNAWLAYGLALLPPKTRTEGREVMGVTVPFFHRVFIAHDYSIL